MSVLEWIEATRLATFVRESLSLLAYPTFSTLHTTGLGIIVGLSSMVSFRLLGFAPTIPLPPLRRLFPVMWFAFGINLFSGSGLLTAAATRLATHPLFVVKLICVFAAVAVLGVLQVKVFRDPELGNKPLDRWSKILAVALLALWLLSIIFGRLTAYTYVTLAAL
jgi:hypothetical protein